MTMHIKLSPEMERYLRDKVATGFYGNVTEVIRDAIRRMQAAERASTQPSPGLPDEAPPEPGRAGRPPTKPRR